MITFLRSFAFLLLFLKVLPGCWGIRGIWLAVPLAEFLTLLISVGYMIFMKKGNFLFRAPVLSQQRPFLTFVLMNFLKRRRTWLSCQRRNRNLFGKISSFFVVFLTELGGRAAHRQNMLEFLSA